MPGVGEDQESLSLCNGTIPIGLFFIRPYDAYVKTSRTIFRIAFDRPLPAGVQNEVLKTRCNGYLKIEFRLVIEFDQFGSPGRPRSRAAVFSSLKIRWESPSLHCSAIRTAIWPNVLRASE